MADKSSSNSFVKFKNPIVQTTHSNNPIQAQKSSLIINIPGCKTSLHNNQLLASIGIPSIDHFIGGGLPVGSICLIGEDVFNYYSDIICRCFIAEGLLNKHSVYIANPFTESTNLLQRIPNVSSKEIDNKDDNDEEKEKIKTQLRIAWRYGDSSSITSSSPNSKLSETHNYFLLNKYMNINESSDIKLFKFNYNSTNLYKDLSSDLNDIIDGKFNINKLKQFNNILRIVINSIGTSFWNDNYQEELENTKIFKFLLYLRNICRHSLGVCLITIPNNLSHNNYFLSKISHLTDYVILVDDSETTKSKLNKIDHDGFFFIKKIPRLNTINSFSPETLDLVFSIKKKRLVVEILHLPPDILEDDNEKKGRTSTASITCGSFGQSKLDF